MPSEAMITEMSFGTLSLRVSWLSLVNSWIQRSDPAGFGTSVSVPRTVSGSNSVDSASVGVESSV